MIRDTNGQPASVIKCENPLQLRDANLARNYHIKSACFKGSRTCREMLLGIFGANFGQKRSHRDGCFLLNKGKIWQSWPFAGFLDLIWASERSSRTHPQGGPDLPSYLATKVVGRTAGNSARKKRSAGKKRSAMLALFPAVLPALFRNSSPAPLSGASGFARSALMLLQVHIPSLSKLLTFFYADFGKEVPSQTFWRGPSRDCPSPSSVMCPLLYRTEHFSRGRKV